MKFKDFINEAFMENKKSKSKGDLRKDLKIWNGIKKDYNKLIKKTPSNQKGKLTLYRKKVERAQKNTDRIKAQLGM